MSKRSEQTQKMMLLAMNPLNERITELEEEVNLWRERTTIPKGEWDICTPHNSAYRTDEGCIRCENEALRELLKEATRFKGGWDVTGWKQRVDSLLEAKEK